MRMNLILEGISNVVYHATTFKKLIEILRTNTMFLSKKDDPEKQRSSREEHTGYKYYLSLARTMNSGYIKDSVSLKGIVIELDGEKLSNSFKGKPFDWHNYKSFTKRKEESKVTLVTKGHDKGTLETINKKLKDLEKDSMNRYYEAEDRLYTIKRSSISNIKKYIKCVHILEDEEAEKRGYYSTLKNMDLDFPIYMYKDKDSLLYSRKIKAKKL